MVETRGSQGAGRWKTAEGNTKVNMVNRSWRRTSIHEAGHAIAACVLGRRFEYVDAPHSTDLRGRSSVGEVRTSSAMNVDATEWTIKGEPAHLRAQPGGALPLRPHRARDHLHQARCDAESEAQSHHRSSPSSLLSAVSGLSLSYDC